MIDKREWKSPSMNEDPDTTTEEGRCQYTFLVYVGSVIHRRTREAEDRGEDTVPINDIDWDGWWGIYRAGWQNREWAMGLEEQRRQGQEED